MEIERRPAAGIIGSPQGPPMSFHNGPADRKAHPHPPRFGRIERLKNPVKILLVEPRPEIPHRDFYGLLIRQFRPDEKVPETGVGMNHRVRPIQNQVQDDLLQLDPVSRHGGKIRGQFSRD